MVLCFKSIITYSKHNLQILVIIVYRNFACIRRTFLHKFLPIVCGCVLYTELEIQGVLHRVPRPHGDRKSMTRHYCTPYQNKTLVGFVSIAFLTCLARLNFSGIGKTLKVLSSCRQLSELFMLPGPSSRLYFRHTNYNTRHECPSPYCL